MQKCACRLLFFWFSCLLFGLASGWPGRAAEEGVREQWGEQYLILREPVVSRTVVEQGRRAAREEGQQEAGACPPPSAPDSGQELFTVTGNPAPRLSWADQDRLHIEFAPGSSPETEYRLVFKPGVTYLSGEPLATAAFSFRCKPVELSAEWLEDHAGGAALLSAAAHDTLEAQELVSRQGMLRATFRRLRHVPLVGWICTSTVPAQLRPATLADGVGSHREVLAALLRSGKPEDIRSDSPLPQCLLALPQSPLVAGARYELEVSADPGSGYMSTTCELGELPEALTATLERALVAEGEQADQPYGTRLSLRFSHPVEQQQLHALWNKLGIMVNGQAATRKPDGSYHAEVAGKTISLRLRGLAPCPASSRAWHEQVEYHYAPAGCAQGMDIDVSATWPGEVQLTLPPDVCTPHGLTLAEENRTLAASVSPASPAFTGNGSNLVAWSGEHCLRLPLINVGAVTATAYRWEAENAARLLPVIQHGMRDDTVFCELFPRLAWMRRRAKESGLSTEGWLGEDARTEAGRALHLLQQEREKSEPLRQQALAEATAYAPQDLSININQASNGLVSRGEALLDLDQLTGGKLRPGLYLISLTCQPTQAVQQALADFGMDEPGRTLPCTVDYLVQVTDLNLRRGRDHLLVNSLATGQPLPNGQLSFYELPIEADKDADEEAKLAAAAAQAVAVPDMPARHVVQGEVVLPPNAGGKLLLLKRGEDYALLSLWQQQVQAPATEAARQPALELFCDRPLYRPGDVVHLRGVVRRPTRGGLALPRAQGGQLTIYKPNGDVLEQRILKLDAYGALSADITLPAGEQDVTGTYRCHLQVEESGRKVSRELGVACEVFRRDAFKASLSLELDPVAPRSYRVSVQASDYNASPVAGGKVELVLHSSAQLQDAEGKVAARLQREEGKHELKHQLVLDGEGRASICGTLATFEQEGSFTARATVANDREEYVQAEAEQATLAPADFIIRLDGARRLRLLDAQSGGERVLPREQELELRLVAREEVRHELPSGIYSEEDQERELLCQRITVPANCHAGLPLQPLLESLEWGRAGLTLRLSGQDAQQRSIRHEQQLFNYGLHEETSLVAEGRHLCLETSSAFREAGQVHACISSQGKLRHALVEVAAGAQKVCVPLTEQEYGEVHLTLICCEQDAWGTYTQWRELSGHCELPRPDKELRVELSLPEGARPADSITIRGQVIDAAGQPVKAALTLFAVDAGMMSVAPYTLPALATSFYRGVAEHFYLSGGGRVDKPCQPVLLELPNVWSTAESEWEDSQGRARYRSVWPAGLETGAFTRGVGSLFRQDMSSVVRAAQPDFSWNDFFGLGERAEMVYSPAPAALSLHASANETVADDAGAEEEEGRAATHHKAAAPRQRSNFEPVALWLASAESAADGSFEARVSLPDTLTTYKVYAVALSASGESFGQGEGEFLVMQDLMLTAGTPHFMSTGDTLRLPLTITNNREESGSWEVTVEGAGELPAQQVTLEAKATTTLFFDITPGEEECCTLRWVAHSAGGSDAVQGSFPVRYPAPMLRETHRLVLADGAEVVEGAALLAPELAESARGSIALQYSTSPLLHLAGEVDFLLAYPYGGTEQRASALLPWLFHDKLAPFCPQMAMTSADDAQAVIARSIGQLLARQQEDGGFAYWAPEPGRQLRSCPWVSAYTGLVLTIAREQGASVPEAAMEQLRNYLARQRWEQDDHLCQYAAARARGRHGDVNRILVRALRQELENANSNGWRKSTANLEFMAELRSNPAGRHQALLRWLRSQGRDYRHRTSWNGGWMLIALSEYLRLEHSKEAEGSIILNGETRMAEAKAACATWTPAAGQRLADIAPRIEARKGTVYLRIDAKAQPEQTDYPGITEQGLQVTRLYELRDADGQWQPATEFKVGDLVRVTLTCAKIADELEYFVLEDYLPASMEAINPRVPSQAAGLDDGGWGSWSHWFDHKEYLSDRVRGFCTRWAGRDVVNMSYYARVKRAGESTAAQAQAQLLYEPQIYGLSNNMRVRSK